MNHLETLTSLKTAVSNAKYCNATDEYKHLVIDAELSRIEHLIDELLKEYRYE